MVSEPWAERKAYESPGFRSSDHKKHMKKCFWSSGPKKHMNSSGFVALGPQTHMKSNAFGARVQKAYEVVWFWSIGPQKNLMNLCDFGAVA